MFFYRIEGVHLEEGESVTAVNIGAEHSLSGVIWYKVLLYHYYYCREKDEAAVGFGSPRSRSVLVRR